MGGRAGIVAALLGAMAVGWAAGAGAATAAQVDQARASGLAWLLQHQNGDGSWSSASLLGVQSTSAALGALRGAGVGHGYAYSSGVAWLQNADAASVDSISRRIAALGTAGVNVADSDARLLAARNIRGAWGAYPGFGTSLPDTPLALGALLQTQVPSTNDVLSALCAILPAQQADGGWPYLVGAATTPANQRVGAILPTAYAVLALNTVVNQLHYGGVTCSVNGVATSYTFSTVMNNAVAWLLTKQSATDHGFGDNGSSTVQETTLAYRVLSQLQPTATTTAQAMDYLVAQQQADGGWEGNAFLTGQVLRAFPAAALTDTDNDGIPDAVETVLGTNPNVPDGRVLVKGNGAAVAGTTAPGFGVQAFHYQAFQYALAASGGPAPLSWELTSGALPDGLSLNPSTGLVSGLPVTLGTFNFGYAVTDGNGDTTHSIGQITVVESAGDSEIPTLPQWGAILMGALLLATTFRLHRSRGRRS